MKTNKKTILPDLETLTPILMGVWRRFHKLSGPPDQLQTREFRTVVAAVKAIEEHFLDGKSLVGEDYFKNPDLLGAYLLYQWVIHYQEALSTIGELPEPPRRVLDICSGPAPLAFAALRHGATDVTAIDQNADALKLGSEIAGRYGLTMAVRKWNAFKQPLPVDGQFDLIMVGHCLEELFPSTEKNWQEGQHLFLRKLIDRLTPKGHLLILENSFGESNRRVLQLRDKLVSNGVPVQAPCIWRGECPSLKVQNSPCYAQRKLEKSNIIKQIQRASSINLSSVKMSYIIFRNPVAGWPDLGDKKVYRVISPPIESYEGKRFYLCGTDGKKQVSSQIKEHHIEARAFDYFSRGEAVSFTNVLENENSFRIVENSQVHVVAPCGKPIED